METIITFKPEASEQELGETAVWTFGILLDLQQADSLTTKPLRGMAHVRYLKALEGGRAERWRYKKEQKPLIDIGTRSKTWLHFHHK